MLLHQGQRPPGQAEGETEKTLLRPRTRVPPLSPGRATNSETGVPPAREPVSPFPPLLGARHRTDTVVPTDEKPGLRKEVTGLEVCTWPKRDNEARLGGDREGVAKVDSAPSLAHWPRGRSEPSELGC